MEFTRLAQCVIVNLRPGAAFSEGGGVGGELVGDDAAGDVVVARCDVDAWNWCLASAEITDKIMVGNCGNISA